METNLTRPGRNKRFARALKRKVKESFRSLGINPCTHIGDLDLSHTSFLSSKKDIVFLNEVYSFFLTLDPLQRIVFVREFLESGNYMAFWWRLYYDEREFRQEYALIADMAIKSFGGFFNEEADPS